MAHHRAECHPYERVLLGVGDIPYGMWYVPYTKYGMSDARGGGVITFRIKNLKNILK
jgi:hypothetical protein